ncbi:MAG: UDP-N-acetylglucosamine 2-epimerase (non-hydrolyzing) [Pirellulales bacterium]|nr:UDP-N-acetylglucosamine 2-epimerase (non-hydrolyzing) [Pirellulales bacterium]
MRRHQRATVLPVIGTRPEAIKLAPVIQALRRTAWADCPLLHTGQHRELADDALTTFGIAADFDLDLMRPGQALGELTSRLLDGIDGVLAVVRPSLVLVAGDTTTVMAAALAAVARRVPVVHVEAGLRTGDLAAPFPEELNRVLTTRLATLHCAPTSAAQHTLLAEGVPGSSILVTGNPVIDALRATARRERIFAPWLAPGERLVLITAHRRESFGTPLERICQAVETLASRYDNVRFVWPLHPNPAVRTCVEQRLGDVARVQLCEPLGYREFVAALAQCHFVMTDSGGVQEEAPALGKPVLVLRDVTERPEAIASGQASLVGTVASRIVHAASRLLGDDAVYRSMQRAHSPYGDGRAAERIVQGCRNLLAQLSVLRPEQTAARVAAFSGHTT